MHTFMYTSKHKAQHHPLFVCSLYNPIKFFIILLIPVLLVLELVCFYLPLKSLST